MLYVVLITPLFHFSTYSVSDIANANDSIGTSADLDHRMKRPDGEDVTYMKLKELALGHASSGVNSLEHVDVAAADCLNLVLETHGNGTITSGKGKDESSSD